jgi:hypothetical protein
MELSSFSENIITVPYQRSGEIVNLDINIDVFTPEFFRRTGKKFEERMKGYQAIDAQAKGKGKARAKADPAQNAKDFFENEARALEIKREIHAELLAGGVLKGWDLVENGLPIQPVYDVLVRLPPLLVEDIWNLALEKAKTVKKRVEEETEGISENSPSGTRAPLALAPTG